MKKIIFAILMMVLLLIGCSSDMYLGENPITNKNNDEQISFSSLKGNMQKDINGSSAATLLGNQFYVYGIGLKGTDTTKVFDNYSVTYNGNAMSTNSNTNGWEYVGNTSKRNALQSIRYWDMNLDKYKFAAASGIGSTEFVNTEGYQVSVNLNTAGNVYISDKVTVKPDKYKQTVTMSFRRLTSRIRVGFYETIPGYAVKDMKFYYTTSATGSQVVGLGSNYPNNGKYNVTFTDSDSAHVSYSSTGETQRYMTFGNLDYTYSNSYSGDSTKPYLDASGNPSATKVNAFIGTTTTSVTYAKGSYTIDGKVDSISYYRPILPDENHNCPLYLNADFTLVPIDGSASTISVYQASTMVPVEYCQWKPNYSYTYIFKISDRINGSTKKPDPTDFPVEPTDPSQPINPATPTDPSIPVNPNDTALFAITFDVVVADVIDNMQQTITTVTTPSITTYQLGVNHDNTNEYEYDKEIYVSGCINNTTSSNVQLYIVTSGNATESLAELAYKQGKSNPASDDYDKTSLKMSQIYGMIVTNVPMSDGTSKQINAMSFVPQQGKTYVARFSSNGKTAYKIIKTKD